jgi:hypothetical protein
MITKIEQLTPRGGVRRAKRWVAVATLPVALCLTTLAACAAGDGAAGPGGGSPRTRVPDELVGSWYSGNVSPTEFVDPNTGHHLGNGYGKGLFYTFNADGTFEEGFQRFSNLYDCGTLTFIYVKGTVTVDESTSTLELHPTSAKIVEQNSCNGYNDSHAVQWDPERIAYRRGTDEYGATALWMLWMPDDDSEWTAFHPKEWYTS